MLYLYNGSIQKFPLDRESIGLGRSSKNDLCIREGFVSKRHARLTVLGDEILIEDLQSKNGIFYENMKVSKMRIKLNESFRIGYIEFFMKRGNPEEFVLSPESAPIVWKVSDLISSSWGEARTRLDEFDRVVITALHQGFRIQKFSDILDQIKEPLTNIFKQGSLLIATAVEDENKILTAQNFAEDPPLDLDQVIGQLEISDQEVLRQTTQGKDEVCWYAFPLEVKGLPVSLIYLDNTGADLPDSTIQLLRDLSREFSLIHSLIEQNRLPEESLAEGEVGLTIVCEDEAMIRLREKCRKIARSDLFVLIEGEMGTGKDLLAQWLHLHSDRRRDTYVKVNCAGLGEGLLEVELFGRQERPGKIELSSEGTLVLDEIGEMPLDLQAKILRVIQERELYRLGEDRPLPVDLKIISLSRQDVRGLIEENRFRQDLYYQVAPVSLVIPPLRERVADIVPLAHHFTEVFAWLNQVEVEGFSAEALEALETYDWPGNVRELENEIKSAVNQTSSGGRIDLSVLKPEVTAGYKNEKKEIQTMLEESKWNKSRAARRLSLSRTALYKKMKKLGIK